MDCLSFCCILLTPERTWWLANIQSHAHLHLPMHSHLHMPIFGRRGEGREEGGRGEGQTGLVAHTKPVRWQTMKHMPGTCLLLSSPLGQTSNRHIAAYTRATRFAQQFHRKAGQQLKRKPAPLRRKVEGWRWGDTRIRIRRYARQRRRLRYCHSRTAACLLPAFPVLPAASGFTPSPT